jgi:hypothetical protein
VRADGIAIVLHACLIHLLQIDAIVNSDGYKKGHEAADLIFDIGSSPIVNDTDLRPIGISSVTGLPLIGEDGARKDEVRTYSLFEVDQIELTPRRVFEPLSAGAHYEDQIRH